MMWETPAERLVLLELLVLGTVKRRQAQAEAWETLAELSWTRRTRRRDELGLVEDRRGELVSLLARVWPAWADVLAELTARGMPPTPDGWMELEDARRADGLPVLPHQLNRRTAAAIAAPHSKATLTERRRSALGSTETTHDGSVRLRPPEGLLARGPGGVVDLASIAAVLGEVSVPERALKAGLTIEGPLRAVLLIENLGAFCDLPTVDGWLFAHVAGWDTATVVRLLDSLARVPVIQFGDLDPNGVRILQHLRGRFPALKWFVPAFWEEFVESKGQSRAWPQDLDLRAVPDLVRRIAARGLWLEQEPLIVDPRTPAALAEML
ncbi:MAG: Wadjet anti-phage system protein JetD domain-containing protein [Vicinamibacterales bacterium]